MFWTFVVGVNPAGAGAQIELFIARLTQSAPSPMSSGVLGCAASMQGSAFGRTAILYALLARRGTLHYDGVIRIRDPQSMPPKFDRAAEDLGNSIHLEHVNVQVPDQHLATLFYVAGLGLTRDPYLMVSDDNMWV